MHSLPLPFALKWPIFLVMIVVAAIGLWMPIPVQGAPDLQQNSLSALSLSGELPSQYSAHFLGLEPSVRDGVVVLTLAYNPSDVPQLRGKVNFTVLTEDGLRKFVAGSDYRDLGVASGAPMQFDPVGNKMRAAFKDSGRGSYTVVVHNDSTTPVDYTLSAIGGILLDDAGQTLSSVPLTPNPAPPPAAQASDDTSRQATAAESTQTASTALVSPGFGTVSARRLSGNLKNQFSKHYLELEPDVRDGIVNIGFKYDPQNNEELAGNINFWILDEDGVRRMVSGDDPNSLNLATGFPTPFSPFTNELSAGFKTAGKGPYTAVTYNNSVIPATYVMSLQGGVLVDRYGQTNESRAAAAELAAVEQSQSGGSGATGEIILESAESGNEPSIGTIPAGITLTSPQSITGHLNKAYEHHYLGLEPSIRDGNVVLTLDFDPKENQELAENINFWVLNEDNLRRVVAGAHPSDFHVAVGSPVKYGLDRGKLRAVFNASGRGDYTVIVYNNSEVPAQYSVRANGATLASESANRELTEALP